MDNNVTVGASSAREPAPCCEQKIGRTVYENRYGRLVVEPFTDVMYVRDIHAKNLPGNIKFSIDVAERVALITGNARTQLALNDAKDLRLLFLLVHVASDRAWVAKIVDLSYAGPADAQQEISHSAMSCQPSPAEMFG